MSDGIGSSDWRLLHNIGPISVSFLPLIGAFVLIISVLYEVFYFLYIDINLLNIYSLSDYIANSIRWIPISVLIIAIISALSGIIVHVGAIVLGKKNVVIGGDPDNIAPLFIVILIIIAGIMGLFSVFILLFHPPTEKGYYSNVGVLIMVLNMVLVFLNGKRIMVYFNKFPKIKRFGLGIPLIPGITAFFLSIAVTDAANDLLNPRKQYQFEQFPGEKITFLRSTSGGIIVYRETNRRVYVIHDSKILLSTEIRLPNDISIECENVGYSCGIFRQRRLRLF